MIWLRVDLLTKRHKHPSGSFTVPKLWEGRCFIKAKGLFFWVLKGNIYIPPITMWGSSFLLPTRSRRTHPTVMLTRITLLYTNLCPSRSSASTCLYHTPLYQLVYQLISITLYMNFTAQPQPHPNPNPQFCGTAKDPSA